MPGGNATRPGDVFKSRNGTYVHVDNTDAEGRLVLSDVLTYASEQGASHIIDVATLTGACMVALGKDIAGVMSPDPAWSDTIRQAGLSVGEECWPMPLYGGYDELLSHPHADVNNMGGRFGGASQLAFSSNALLARRRPGLISTLLAQRSEQRAGATTAKA